MPISHTNGRLRGFDRLVRQCMKDWDVPGAAIGIVHKGRTLYARGFGLRDIDSGHPVTERTLLGIASCTKAFTATSCGILVEDGKLGWDTPIRTYLPDFRMYDPVATRLMTVRDLLTHRSGLPGHNFVWSTSSATRLQLLKRLRHLKPSRSFRSTYQYNNLMYMAAGAVIERLSGQTWEDFVRDRILKPSRMTDTRLWTNDLSDVDDIATGYMNQGQGMAPDPRVPGDHGVPYAIAPAGSILSNVLDMCRWLELQMAGGKSGKTRIISEQALKEIHTPQVAFPGEAHGPGLLDASYAMGWVVQPYRGHRWLNHYGGFAGFTALTSFMPDESIGIVVLANREGLPPFVTAVSFKAYERVLGLQQARWYLKKQDARSKARTRCVFRPRRLAGKRRPIRLEGLNGLYRNPGYGQLRVTMENRRTVLRYNGMIFEITLRRERHFEMSDDYGRQFQATFVADKSGQADAITIPFEPAVDSISFERIASPTDILKRSGLVGY